MPFVPAGGAALAWILGAAVAFMFLYPPDKSRMARVESDLIERRQHLQVD